MTGFNYWNDMKIGGEIFTNLIYPQDGRRKSDI